MSKCGDCKHGKKSEILSIPDSGECAYPFPKWLITMGSTRLISLSDDSADCPCFEEKSHD